MEGLRIVRPPTRHVALQLDRAVELVDNMTAELETPSEAVTFLDSLLRILTSRRTELLAPKPPAPEAAA
jgi:hypothetical protein